MAPDRRRPFYRRPEEGATLVEFALVAPVVLMLLFGIISGCFLAYQNSALHNGATAGARAASIESPLENSSYCETGSPSSIIAAVAKAAPLLDVNPAPLCDPSGNGSSSTLTQTPQVNGDVNIVVSCFDATDSPEACGSSSVANVGVSLVYTTNGLAEPFGLTYHMTATSQDPAPVLSVP